MPRPRSSKSKGTPPPPADQAATRTGRARDPRADADAPTRVMRQGGDPGPRPGKPAPATDEPPTTIAPGPDTDLAGRPRTDDARSIAGLGSGLLARQPAPGEGVAVVKTCPHCGNEYETDTRFCPQDGAALRPKGGADSLIGNTLGDRYHILSLVGEGGMGRIYLAEHVRMERQCAVKLMRPSLVNDADAAARFAREASSAARIIHPNVAAVFDYGESDGRVYLVMEYVDGESLGGILQRERTLAVARAVELARQVADGLACAHELGIVHRDLKPDNILVTRTKSGKEVAKVVDFGIAKAIEEGPGQRLTETGLVIGTPEFMSPEQLIGDPVDARSDVYALGCILYLMLAGAPAADAPTREGMLKRRLNEPAPHPRVANPAVPAELDATVVRALARSPAERYQSAAELRDALTAILARLPDAAMFATGSSATEQTGAMPLATGGSATVGGGRRFGTRHAAGASVLVLAVTTLFLVQGDRGAGATGGRLTARPEGMPALTPPVLSADTSASPAGISAPATGVDTTALRAPRNARGGPVLTPHDTARADSLRRAQRAAAAAQRQQLEQPLRAIADAIRARDIDRLRATYPGLTEAQAGTWQRNFSEFQGIAVDLRIEDETANAATTRQARVDFRLHFSFTDRSGTTSSAASRYTAQYAHENGRWVLRAVAQRG